jgi:hypothetical protein
MQNMRDFFRSNLGRGLRDLDELDRLSAAWPVACGSALAARAEVSELDAERVLHLTVASPEWMQPFLQMRTALQNDLARIAAVRLTGIHFEVKGRARTSRAPFLSRK